MKRFVTHIILMSMLFGVLYLFVSWISFSSFRNNASFLLPPNTTAVIIGHSHPECAIDDALLKETVNLAFSAEAYYYSYQKLKRVIKDNPKLEVVYLEFTNNQISSIMDDWTFGMEKQSHHMPKYIPFLNAQEIGFFTGASYDSFSSAFLKSTKENFFRLFSRDYLLTDELGGYKRLSRVIRLENSIGYSEDEDKLFNTISKFNLEMLDSILKLSDKNNLEVIGIRSPQHSSIPDLLNEPKFDSIRDLKFINREFWDFNALNLSDSSFADPGHLNAKGARQYTSAFKQRIRLYKTESN